MCVLANTKFPRILRIGAAPRDAFRTVFLSPIGFNGSRAVFNWLLHGFSTVFLNYVNFIYQIKVCITNPSKAYSPLIVLIEGLGVSKKTVLNSQSRFYGQKNGTQKNGFFESRFFDQKNGFVSLEPFF